MVHATCKITRLLDELLSASLTRTRPLDACRAASVSASRRPFVPSYPRSLTGRSLLTQRPPRSSSSCASLTPQDMSSSPTATRNGTSWLTSIRVEWGGRRRGLFVTDVGWDGVWTQFNETICSSGFNPYRFPLLLQCFVSIVCSCSSSNNWL
jgi:hypothetical protein